jgi:hypothetical protein
MSDHLTDSWPKHWTGADNPLSGLVRIDGKPYRFLGPEPEGVQAMDQREVRVWPTRSVYRFEAAGVELEVEFLSPLLTDDIDILTRPATYITFSLKSLDGRSHDAAVYFDCSAALAVDRPRQHVVWSRYKLADLDLLSFSSKEQPVLAKNGDDLRIDWGHLYLAVPAGNANAIRPHGAREEFAGKGAITEEDDLRMPRAAHDDWPVLACVLGGLKVGAAPVERKLILAYDDELSMEYLGRRLPPIWRLGGASAGDMILAAGREYGELRKRCRDWDDKLMAEFEKAGGPKYAEVAALAYRQCIAGHKILRDVDGKLLMFSKENFSNGCACTVDVSYPSAPFFVKYSTPLLKAMLTPILEYASGPRWPWPFAPHDLGTYPLANGQVYGGGERTEEDQMPVEECGNMLVMVAAACLNDGNAAYAEPYWPTLTKWAEYLRAKGLDPEHQLCTDDFAGHMAHNVNLAAKAIVAIGAFGRLCELKGDQAKAQEYTALARGMAAEWAAKADDGECFRLAFDKPGTWSQKYNLLWDRIFKLGIFPEEVAEKEVASYKGRQNQYGLPLDVRADYTKGDWIVWTACLTGKRADFDALFEPLYDYMNETPSRVPLSDWHDTKTGKQVGFQARTVVGGLFVPLLVELR